jgi:hypothetical protein
MYSDRTDVRTPVSGLSSGKEPIRLAQVVDCNPAAYTVDVKLSRTEAISSVPILNAQGASQGRDVAWLQNLRGATVVLLLVYHQYYVLGTVPTLLKTMDLDQVQDVVEEAPEHGGGNEETYQNSVERNYHGGRPIDFYPQDKVLATDTGVLLGLFNAGLIKLKASPLCQIVMGRFKDFIRFMARRIQAYTDFGEIETVHTPEGKVGLHIKGGASFADETHPAKAEWTVQAWLGHDPNDEDSRLHLLVNNVAKDKYVTMTFDVHGNLLAQATQDITLVAGRDANIKVAQGDLNILTEAGNAVISIEGKTVWTSKGTMDIDGGSGDLSGAVTKKCKCAFTGEG